MTRTRRAGTREERGQTRPQCLVSSHTYILLRSRTEKPFNPPSQYTEISHYSPAPSSLTSPTMQHPATARRATTKNPTLGNTIPKHPTLTAKRRLLKLGSLSQALG